MENNLETAKDANQLVNCSFLHPLHTCLLIFVVCPSSE